MAGIQQYMSAIFTANTAGAQVFVSGPNPIAGISVPQAQGLVHSITISADSTAQTISLYDGTGTAAPAVLRFKVVTPTTTPVTQLIVDIQFNVGCFIVISGGTSVVDTVVFI